MNSFPLSSGVFDTEVILRSSALRNALFYFIGVFFNGKWGSELVSRKEGLSTVPSLMPLPWKTWVLHTSKCRKYQEGRMQTPNSAPLALIWILMTKAPLQWVKIRGARLSPDPVTTCQQEKWVNFHWLFFRAGYCTLMNNQKATSWKITEPLTALVLNLPCTFSYILPLIADIISAWPLLWHRFYSNIAVSSCLCSSPCFPGLFHCVCLTCQSSPSLPPQSQPIRKGCTTDTSISVLMPRSKHDLLHQIWGWLPRCQAHPVSAEGTACGGCLDGVI